MGTKAGKSSGSTTNKPSRRSKNSAGEMGGTKVLQTPPSIRKTPPPRTGKPKKTPPPRTGSSGRSRGSRGRAPVVIETPSVEESIEIIKEREGLTQEQIKAQEFAKKHIRPAHTALPTSQPTTKHADQPTILIHGKTPSDLGKDVQVHRDPRIKEVIKEIDEDIRQIQIENTPSEPIEYSDINKKIQETTSKISQGYRNVATKINDSDIPILHDVNKKIAVTLLESGARTFDMAGMAAGGTEILIKKPELIKPSLQVGLYASTIGLGKEFKEHPVQTTSDLLVSGFLFHSVSRIGSKVNIPYTLSKKSTAPEALLLKTKVDVQPSKSKTPSTHSCGTRKNDSKNV